MTVMHGVVFDCADPLRISAFWKDVLEYEYRVSEDDWYSLRNPRSSDAPFVSFQTVSEAKAVKNRIHLDIRPEGRTRDEERTRLEALGATTLRLVDDNPQDIHYIMADPEGNEFCILDPH